MQYHIQAIQQSIYDTTYYMDFQAIKTTSHPDREQYEQQRTQQQPHPVYSASTNSTQIYNIQSYRNLFQQPIICNLDRNEEQVYRQCHLTQDVDQVYEHSQLWAVVVLLEFVSQGLVHDAMTGYFILFSIYIIIIISAHLNNQINKVIITLKQDKFIANINYLLTYYITSKYPQNQQSLLK